MAVFEDIVLSWAGKDYTVRANRVIRTIAAIEDVITLQELIEYGERGVAPLAKLSMAYAAVLRTAGARVTDDEVYDGMFSGTGMDNAVTDAISVLLSMMVPPSAMTKSDDAKKKSTATPAAQ